MEFEIRLPSDNPVAHSYMRLAAHSAVALLAVPCLAQTPSFTLIQPAPGFDQTLVTGLSADGLTAIGQSNIRANQLQLDSFFWSSASARQDFSANVAGTVSGADARAISGNGQYAVGTKTLFAMPTDHVFRASLDGGYENIGRMPNRQYDYIGGVNGDGSVIVGYGQNGGGSTVPFATPFRWTASGGFQDLGTLHPTSTYVKANAVSRDGNVVVGTDIGNYVSGPLDAFMWTPLGGMQRLAPASNSPFGETDARGISADGLVIVGNGNPIANPLLPHAWRWTQEAGMQDLGMPVGARDSAALLANVDGSVLVCTADVGPVQNVPYLWTELAGFETLSDYFSVNGAPLPSGYQSSNITGISDDAQTFAGNVILQDGTMRGFVATVPAPGAILLFGPAALVLCKRRR